MVQLILVLIGVILLFILTPIALWFLIRTIFRRVSNLKSHSGWIASFIVLVIPFVFFYNLFTDRSASDIYKALFKTKTLGCTQVFDCKDAHLPIIDNDIWIHFRTCPTEMKRIVSLENYEPSIQSASFMKIKDKSINANAFGDSVRVYNFSYSGGGRVIYTSLDSTEAYCFDADF